MGQTLSAGVAYRIDVHTTQEKKKIVLERLSQYVDLSLYEERQDEKDANIFTLFLKTSVFNDNIHDLIIKMDSVMYLGYGILQYLEYDKLTVKNFNQKHFPIKMFEGKDLEGDNTLLLDVCGDEWRSDGSYSDSVVSNVEGRDKDIRVSISYYALWEPMDKFYTEADVYYVGVINGVSRNAFDNPLWKSVLFYLLG